MSLWYNRTRKLFLLSTAVHIFLLFLCFSPSFFIFFPWLDRKNADKMPTSEEYGGKGWDTPPHPLTTSLHNVDILMGDSDSHTQTKQRTKFGEIPSPRKHLILRAPSCKKFLKGSLADSRGPWLGTHYRGPNMPIRGKSTGTEL